MQPSKRSKTLTGYASCRLTPAEESLVIQAAERQGLTKSEWLRRAVLQQVNGSTETRLLMAEFLALRAVVLGIHTEVLRGAPLTEARIAEALAQAEARKYAMADNRMQAMRSEVKV